MTDSPRPTNTSYERPQSSPTAHLSDRLHEWRGIPADDRFSYVVLRKCFPWSRCFRAGFAIIFQPEDKTTIELLFLQQNATYSVEKYGTTNAHSLRGMPKGHSEPQDVTAFDTAVRELREESGIDILTSSAVIKRAPIILRRQVAGYDEITIYFVAIFKERPAVKICQEEIVDFHWFDMRFGFRELWDNVSLPTRHLLTILENTDIYT